MPAIPTENREESGLVSHYLRMLAGFWHMSLADKLGFIGAWVLMLIAASLLALVHFRRLAGLLGQPMGAISCIPVATPREEARARFIRRAILRASRLSPLRHDCLPQALVGVTISRLLEVPVTLHLGVKLEGEPGIEAHAWLCTGRVAVTGGFSFNEFVTVACFATSRGKI